MRMHAYTSCNGTGRWKFPIRKLNDLVALPKRPAAGRQRGQHKHRSRRTGPPPAGRALVLVSLRPSSQTKRARATACQESVRTQGRKHKHTDMYIFVFDKGTEADGSAWSPVKLASREAFLDCMDWESHALPLPFEPTTDPTTAFQLPCRRRPPMGARLLYWSWHLLWDLGDDQLAEGGRRKKEKKEGFSFIDR